MGTGKATFHADGLPPAAGQAVRIVTGRAGDHAAVEQFLLAVFQQPSAQEFQAILDEPQYEPADRLLVKYRDEILAHAHLRWGSLHFGARPAGENRDGRVLLPFCRIGWLGVLPEYRGRRLAAGLLAAAERTAAGQAVITELDAWPEETEGRDDWTVCPRFRVSKADPRKILSHLAASQEDRPAAAVALLKRNKLVLRHFRRIELAGLMRIYAANTASAYGPLLRNEAYWHWLIGRGGFDKIFVALAGGRGRALGEIGPPIAGYAVTREHRILELMTAPDSPEATVRLLRRACRDAIERDYHALHYHGPPHDPLHRLFETAGNGRSDPVPRNGAVPSGSSMLVKVSDLPGLARAVFGQRLCPAGDPPAVQQAAAAAENHFELGIDIDGRKHRLAASPAGVDFTPGSLGRRYIACDRHTFVRLLLGYDGVEPALAADRLAASTPAAAEMAATLFHPHPVAWHSAWDDAAA